ncbi:hypothetical protein GCM10011309_25660 [Litorimonas cladophorae]|uniref:Uncharacterized protein n=1 Tax=Litorimonas cladophorae TaxID=1220491 RepID=A0A918KUY1_9PROT|nr:hypothetical protein [Litorimonas cladophorae]GGX74396.1 hypothetical protein GCM10011309_25660 [Litorimonas cladophorae]
MSNDKIQFIALIVLGGVLLLFPFFQDTYSDELFNDAKSTLAFSLGVIFLSEAFTDSENSKGRKRFLRTLQIIALVLSALILLMLFLEAMS